MTHCSEQFKSIRKNWNIFSGIFVISTLVIAIFYLVHPYPWKNHVKVNDPFFVAIIVTNAIVLHIFVCYLIDFLMKPSQTFTDYIQASCITIKVDEERIRTKSLPPTWDSAIASIFDIEWGLLGGLFYGTCFLFTIDSFIKSSNGHFNPLLPWFLFSANVVTGMALVFLGRYSWKVWRLVKFVNIDLWDRLSCPHFATILRANCIIFYVTAYVASAALLSVQISDLFTKTLVLLFNVITLLIIAAAYIAPIAPIIMAIRDKKNQEIKKVAVLIQQEYRNQHLKMRDPAQPVNLDRYSKLQEFYSSVVSLRVYPVSGRTSWFSAATKSLSFMPVFIELIRKLALPK